MVICEEKTVRVSFLSRGHGWGYKVMSLSLVAFFQGSSVDWKVSSLLSCFEMVVAFRAFSPS